MSTPATPATPTAPTPTLIQDIQSVEKRVGLWLDPAHITLIILLVIASLGITYVWESKRADVAEAKAQIATQVAEAAKEASASSAIQNAANQEAAKATEAAMAAANAQLVTANQQLIKANTQLTTQLATQQKTDATLPPSAQAARIMQLEPKATVAPISGGFTIDSPGGTAILQDLEEIPFDRQKILNFQAEVANDEETITNDLVSLNAEKSAHASDVSNDQKKLAAAQDDLKKVTDDFTAYKHKARRNYIRAFFIGVVVGVIGGHAAGL
jgi:hypothetical protein